PRHSFPTRRSSDLCVAAVCVTGRGIDAAFVTIFAFFYDVVSADGGGGSIAGAIALVGLAVIVSVVAGFAFFDDAVSADGGGGSITGAIALLGFTVIVSVVIGFEVGRASSRERCQG